MNRGLNPRFIRVTGEAGDTIEGVPTSESGYDVAINLLIERFGDPFLVSNSYSDALIKLKAPNYELMSLQSFYDKLCSYIRC